MKKLEDFKAKKVEVKTVYGGRMMDCGTYTSVRGQELNDYDGEDKC